MSIARGAIGCPEARRIPPGRDGTEVRARAEGAAGTPQHRHARRFVPVDIEEGLRELCGRRRVDGIADGGALQDDCGDRSLAFDAYGAGHDRLLGKPFGCPVHLSFREDAPRGLPAIEAV